jgi:hypothetical protein
MDRFCLLRYAKADDAIPRCPQRSMSRIREQDLTLEEATAQSDIEGTGNLGSFRQGFQIFLFFVKFLLLGWLMDDCTGKCRKNL